MQSFISSTFFLFILLTPILQANEIQDDHSFLRHAFDGSLLTQAGPFGDSFGTDPLLGKPSQPNSPNTNSRGGSYPRPSSLDSYYPPGTLGCKGTLYQETKDGPWLCDESSSAFERCPGSSHRISNGPWICETPQSSQPTPSPAPKVSPAPSLRTLEKWTTIPSFPKIPKKPKINPGKTELSLSWLPVSGECHASYWDKKEVNARNLYLSKAGHPELIELIEEVAAEICKETGQSLFVGDLNARGHKGHKRGIDVDILVRFNQRADFFDGGRLSEINVFLNTGYDGTFTQGPGYDREATIKLIEKFLAHDEQKTLYLKEGKTKEKCLANEPRCEIKKEGDQYGTRSRLVPCEGQSAAEPGCWYYTPKVIRVFTSDPEIVKRLNRYKDHTGEEPVVRIEKDHPNHIHIKIDFVEDYSRFLPKEPIMPGKSIFDIPYKFELHPFGKNPLNKND